MAMPIFWRLIYGYSVILLMSVALSSYSILQLGQLSSSARTALNGDSRMIDYQEKLTDVFLSEVRYAGKFLITHARPLHDQLRQFKGDFVRYMDELKALTESPEIKARLARVEEFHLRYHELFDQEVQYVRAGQPYAQTRYREEKEKVLESVLGELVSLKAHLQNHLRDKLETIVSAARTTRNIAVATTIALLGLGIALSFAISKSIVKPLSELRRATENAEDDFHYRSDLSRIPEIHDLAVVLRNEKQRLQDAARTNASFVGSITDQFAMPLISINKRLSYLKQELIPNVTPEQTKHIDILAAEVERLIGRFSRLRQPSKVPGYVGRHEPRNAVETREPRASTRRTFHDSDSFVARAEQDLRAVIARARDLYAGSWNAIRGSIVAGIWKGEKR
ncbi:MAG: CHASE3 domain-containing protein [Candidatus Binatia bacterium]